jgi:hypothetical protein
LIWDGKIQIRYKHPGSATLEIVDYCTYRIVGVFIPEDRRLSSEQVCQIIPAQEAMK